MTRSRETDFHNPTDQVDLENATHDVMERPPVDTDLADADLEANAIAGDMGDVPQEFTESYGTGVAVQPGYSEGGRSFRNRRQAMNAADAALTGGDIDANYEQAYAVGDEAVGGTVVTPDQDIVDDLGAAVGLEMDDRSFLRTNDILEERDDRRWELDPKSSEDYGERRQSD